MGRRRARGLVRAGSQKGRFSEGTAWVFSPRSQYEAVAFQTKMIETRRKRKYLASEGRQLS